MDDLQHILLVEDNQDDIELTLRAFRKNKLSNRIDVARDGEEALEMLFDAAGDGGAALPQFVLLDLKLPKVDGLEVLEQIRSDKRTRMLPVVVLTSSAEDIDLRRAYELGANSYVRKPVDYQEFIQAVRQLGLYWLIVNYPPPAP
ncbi:MAG TPA: response regulator [Gammaproteobacteria bacterium]|nr:response regulator [Gammaproteobacteria bacterium]